LVWVSCVLLRFVVWCGWVSCRGQCYAMNFASVAILLSPPFVVFVNRRVDFVCITLARGIETWRFTWMRH
jgi:hypothetical protein